MFLKRSYFLAVDGYGIALFAVGGVAVLFVIILYIDTVRHIMKNSPPQFKRHSVFVLTVYPVSRKYCFYIFSEYIFLNS